MPTALKYRIGLVQMSCSPDPDDNLDKAADRVREAARAGAQIICLQELFRSQYFCQSEDIALFDLAEPIPGPEHRAAGCGGARGTCGRRSRRCSSGARPGSITTPR